MDFFIRPALPDKISFDQIQDNISAAMNEVKSFVSKASISARRPTYKTVRRFSIDEVFHLFGLKQCALFRLTQSEYSKMLPSVIVIYCNSNSDENDNPVVIDDKLFISHTYFSDWINNPENEVYQAEMLKLIMQNLEIKTVISH